MTGSTSAIDAVIAADVERLAPGVEALGRRIEAATDEIDEIDDWPALLGERAAFDGFGPPSRISCGGAARLLPCADGWVAVNLARPSDIELVPAWLGIDITSDAPLDDERWATIAAAIGRTTGETLVAGASLLGLPVGLLGERPPAPDGGIRRTSFGPSPRSTRVGNGPIRVVDLSALWAGPLCGSLLAAAGAEVIKVESTTRPDGARVGSPALYHRLNGRKEHRSLDATSSAGRAQLATLLARADVVIESARPRALEQLGIGAADLLAAPDGPDVWVSITGHGRSSSRVAFGDDAAVAGGLVCRHQGPRFLADAVADPLAGLAAAAAAFEALAADDRMLLDVSMAGVAATHAAAMVPEPQPASG